MTGIDFGPAPDYQLERARREAAEARIAEFRLAELSGDLIRADQVRSARAKAVAAASAALQQLPARLAPIVAAESDLARCHDAIERELHDLMRQIAVEVLDGGA